MKPKTLKEALDPIFYEYVKMKSNHMIKILEENGFPQNIEQRKGIYELVRDNTYLKFPKDWDPK